MKQLTIVLFISTFLFSMPLNYPSASIEKPHHHHCHHSEIKHEVFQDLLKKGYKKEEIYHAAFIMEHSDKQLKLETILKYHRSNGSWKKTADYFGVDMEKIHHEHHAARQHFYKTNEKQIIQFVAQYTNTPQNEIQQYAKQSLHFLVLGAAISKVSDKPLSEIMAMHQNGEDPDEIIGKLNVDKKVLFKEVRKIHDDIQEKM